MAKGIVVDFRKLKRHAKANRWSGRQIAQKIGVADNTVLNVLKGKVDPSATNLANICNTIGLPIEQAFKRAA